MGELPPRLLTGALIDRGIQWQEIDPQTVSASFTNVMRVFAASGCQQRARKGQREIRVKPGGLLA
jgi:hypothetical protein